MFKSSCPTWVEEVHVATGEFLRKRLKNAPRLLLAKRSKCVGDLTDKGRQTAAMGPASHKVRADECQILAQSKTRTNGRVACTLKVGTIYLCSIRELVTEVPKVQDSRFERLESPLEIRRFRFMIGRHVVPPRTAQLRSSK
jgi:hypothetical protein